MARDFEDALNEVNNLVNSSKETFEKIAKVNASNTGSTLFKQGSGDEKLQARNAAVEVLTDLGETVEGIRKEHQNQHQQTAGIAPGMSSAGSNLNNHGDK